MNKMKRFGFFSALVVTLFMSTAIVYQEPPDDDDGEGAKRCRCKNQRSVISCLAGRFVR